MRRSGNLVAADAVWIIRAVLADQLIAERAAGRRHVTGAVAISFRGAAGRLRRRAAT